MSPKFLCEDGYIFKIYSNEETRVHIHVVKAEREAKFWLEPIIELAENFGFNSKEIKAITKIIEAICTLHSKNALENFEPAKQIGIIVPFRSQISAIRNSLRKQGLACADTITIDTVECYQGSQRDYILYSTTISEPYQVHIISNLQEIDGNIVDRKLNVALTRARKQLFIFGNPEILRHSPLYSDLMSYCRHLDMMSTSLIE